MVSLGWWVLCRILKKRSFIMRITNTQFKTEPSFEDTIILPKREVRQEVEKQSSPLIKMQDVMNGFCLGVFIVTLALIIVQKLGSS
jgi:hypothetical protein